jgi:probable phosphoglycerate mutase
MTITAIGIVMATATAIVIGVAEIAIVMGIAIAVAEIAIAAAVAEVPIAAAVAAEVAVADASDLQIYLCRHGETEWTNSGRHTGLTDIPLTQHGKEQAKKLKARLAAAAFTEVFSSPRIRAVETARLAGYSPTLLEDAAEWNYGDYEGLTSKEIHRTRPGWSIFLDGASGGESPSEVAERADRLLETLASKQSPIALFSHGHFLRALTARWLHLPVKEGHLFYLSVASVGVLGFEGSTRVIRLWNEVLS